MESSSHKIKLFEDRKIRAQWDEEAEKWWFSVVDVIGVLTESNRPRKYWDDLKRKLKAEGSELSEKIGQLKLQSEDGKYYLTDVATTEQLLRLVQSIPSKKAEPFKLWLAKVGREMIDEAIDPELSIDRAIQSYRRLGYSEHWINQRIKSIEVRKALTDEWDKAGVKQGQEYAFLTDLMYKTWSDMSTKEYKKHKGLKKENLRDNMTNVELILNMLAEASATELSQKAAPQDLNESTTIAVSGAEVAKDARKSLEQRGGEVISNKNAKQLGKREMQIKKITARKESFMDLLLLGDEQEDMIRKYLDRGELFALYDDDLKTVAVITKEDEKVYEIKNIATYEHFRGKGYGSAMLRYLIEYCKDKCDLLQLGTGESDKILAFYKRFGFIYSHTIQNFFVDNYDHEMIEDGKPLKDMIYLKIAFSH